MQSPPDRIRVRRATAADVPWLCDLLSLLFAQEADFTPDAERQRRALDLIIGQPELGCVYCATDDAGIAGMVSILFTVSTAEGGRVAWLEDMIVHPDRRGQGIGGKLLHEAVVGARAAGCSRITLLTDATNHGARRFYERAGFAGSRMIPLRLGG